MPDTDLVHIQTLSNHTVVGALSGKIALLYHVANASLPAGFLIRRGGGDQGPLQFESCLLQGISGDHLRYNAAFLVSGAPGVNAPIPDFTAIRICGPASALRHHIVMPGEVNIGTLGLVS